MRVERAWGTLACGLVACCAINCCTLDVTSHTRCTSSPSQWLALERRRAPTPAPPNQYLCIAWWWLALTHNPPYDVTAVSFTLLAACTTSGIPLTTRLPCVLPPPCMPPPDSVFSLLPTHATQTIIRNTIQHISRRSPITEAVVARHNTSIARPRCLHCITAIAALNPSQCTRYGRRVGASTDN